MAPSSPETFKGLLKRAEKAYNGVWELLREQDEDGFIKLVSWNDIDQAVENLARTAGLLRGKISELTKNSSRKEKYKMCLYKIEFLLSELRKKQTERNKK